MCGIVGYVGERDCTDVLLDSLSKLEYRGYDSAGIAVFENGEITVEEYTEIHKKLIEKFDPPMKSVETPGFYLQEVMDDE